ncbi:TOBE domain-containing protein [bacterium]|nr:TOBE domain-containing protein [bacterium]MBU1994732.1 TOBE domain-containing protein [bacterium]
MNKLIARVVQIESMDGLTIVNFDFFGTTLCMMSLDLSADVQAGVQVRLSAKSTHIAIAKDFSGLVSYSNMFEAKIVSVENGQLLSRVHLSVKGVPFESLITLNSSKRMNLQANDDVTLFIKASELSIKEVL